MPPSGAFQDKEKASSTVDSWLCAVSETELCTDCAPGQSFNSTLLKDSKILEISDRESVEDLACLFGCLFDCLFDYSLLTRAKLAS